jgi:hypothetical protein
MYESQEVMTREKQSSKLYMQYQVELEKFYSRDGMWSLVSETSSYLESMTKRDGGLMMSTSNKALTGGDIRVKGNILKP